MNDSSSSVISYACNIAEDNVVVSSALKSTHKEEWQCMYIANSCSISKDYQINERRRHQTSQATVHVAESLTVSTGTKNVPAHTYHTVQ